MTLCCGCDMPIEIYADWCQDQGWDTDELRAQSDEVLAYSYYSRGNGYYADDSGCPEDYGFYLATGSADWFGYYCGDGGGCGVGQGSGAYIDGGDAT